VAFVPATSIDPGGAPIGGVVSVSNFPADQLVHFTQPVAVTGPMTDAEFAAHLPFAVTGPLTDAELRAVPVDVTVDTLPLPDGAASEDTLATMSETLDDVGLTAILQRDRMVTE
jgi:hypothetical protein